MASKDDLLGKDKWNKMPDMKSLAAGSSPCVQVEWLLLFISREDLAEFPMRKEDATSQEVMSFLRGKFFEAFDQVRRDLLRTKLDYN